MDYTNNNSNTILNIKAIIKEEFSKLLKNIECDFEKNYSKKRNNFILNQLDNEIVASMVFVSSFESKSGNAMETCAKKIARLRYGFKNVPNIINMSNQIIEDDPLLDDKTQIIYSNIDMENPDLQGFLDKYMRSHKGKGKKQPSTLTQDEILKIRNTSIKYYNENEIYTKPVDLAFFDGINWNIVEIKAGGDLDSSNAPSNVVKLLTEFSGMNIDNCNAYFGTLYNKDGEGNLFKGTVKSYLSYNDCLLIGSQFWERILPEEISFDLFCSIYREVLEELDLNNHIKQLLKNYETI